MPARASTWALVPVKPLALAKTRLAGVLTGVERQALASFMLRHVLETVAESGVFDGLLVVSSDLAVLRIAAEFGAVTISDTRDAGTNAAVMQGIDLLADRPTNVLALHADLPEISREEVVKAAGILSGGQLLINPDRHDRGTNMLGVPASHPFNPQFGKESFARHLAAAGKLGIEPIVLRQHGVSCDVDVPEDMNSPTISRFVLELRGRPSGRKRCSETEFMSTGQS